MDRENQPNAQQVYIKIAQINCNKSPSAFQQFLSFCDKHKIDLALISEPPIRKNIPNIDKKYRPMYATNSSSSIHQVSNSLTASSNDQVSSVWQTSSNHHASHHIHTMQQVSINQQLLNHLHASTVHLVPNFNQVSTSSNVPVNYQVPSIHLPPSSAQQSTYAHTSHDQHVPITIQPQYDNHSNNSQSSNDQQTINVQQRSDNSSTSTTSHPVRSCIIILNPLISPIIISSLSNVDFLVIETNNFVIASVYSQPVESIETTIDNLNNLTVYAGNKRMLIGGDFNAKSTFWGPHNDDRGEQLLSAIIHNDLTLLNDGIKPTFDTTRGNQRLSSYIDLTIVSQNILDNISEWSVIDDIYNSDHRPILTIISNTNITSTTNRSTVKWNTNNVNWLGWSTAVGEKLRDFNISDNKINNIDNQQQLDLTIAILTNVIHQCCDRFCTKYIDKRTRCDNWHKDAQLQQIVTKQRQIYRKIRRCHNQFALQRYQQTYQQLRHQYRSHLQNLKYDAFNNDINGEGPVSCFQRVSRLIKNSGHMIFKTIEGTTDPVESTTKLVDTLFPNDDPNSDSDVQKSIRFSVNRWLQRNNNVSAPPPITIQELHNAITKFKDGKAPGYDGVSPKILKNFWVSFPDVLLAVYNACLRLGYMPYMWKTSIIRIIPKPGKDDYSKTNAYRPIGLISILGKTLERIIANRISGHLINNGHLSKNQFGFIAGKSTDHAIFNLNREIELALASNDNVALISLDIRGAFDHAWHPFIIQQLIDYRAPKYLIKMMANYQKDRRICVNHGGVSCHKETNRGVVQGSMLGPLNWNIVINDLLAKNLGDDIKMQAYADDIAIVVSSKCKTYLPIKINNILRMAYDWGQKSKLTFSEAKTQIMYVTRRINRPIYSPVAMNNIVIEPVDQMKILGVIFDHRLDFRPHIQYAVTKAINVYRLVNGIARKTYGLSPRVLQLIHHSMIEPIITYGAVITCHATRYQHITNHLRKLLKPLAQKATKAYRTAPVVATSAIADFPPLDLLINLRATIVKSRVTKKYNYYDNEISVDIEEAQEPSIDRHINFIVREPAVMTPSRIFIKSILTNRGIGAAFMVFIDNNRIAVKSFRLPTYGTLQQADLFTIKMAIEWTNINLGGRSTYILTNNIGTVQHLKRDDHRRKQSLANKIAATASNNITIMWTKVDRENQHYRKLKQVARRTGKFRNRRYDYEYIHLKVIKKIEYRNMLVKWDDKYRNDRFGSNIKNICHHVGDARQFSNLINRFLTHTLTGHGQFGCYLARFGISDDIACVCGFPVQDVTHLINDCPMTNRLRNDYRLATSRSTNPKSRIETTAIFFANIAIFADIHRNSIHQLRPP